MDLGLRGRAYVVTAASGGLGAATARALVAEGAAVVLVARRAEVLAELTHELGDHAVALPADLRDADTADRACTLARSSFGRLDGALISVGGPPAGSVLETTDEIWREAFDTVFLAALRVARTVAAQATTNDLVLALVLSTSVKAPLDGLATSNGLRPGLAVLVKQLADELGPRGGRVLGLMPGRVETERVRQLDGLRPDPEAARAEAEARIALRRYGRPEEFARVATFLLSPAASYVTGCVVPVEGGALRAL